MRLSIFDMPVSTPKQEAPGEGEVIFIRSGEFLNQEDSKNKRFGRYIVRYLQLKWRIYKNDNVFRLTEGRVMNLKLKKVYTVSKKAEKPRLFLQHLVCETAGFKPGEELFIKIDEEKEEILIQNFPFKKDGEHYIVHVASRTSKTSGNKRPLVDTAGEKYSFLDINQRLSGYC